MTQTTTQIGRMKLEHPDRGFDTSDSGVALHTAIAEIYRQLSDHALGRYFNQTFTIGQTVTFTHNFGMALSSLTVFLYNGSTLIQVGSSSNWTLAAIDSNSFSITNNTGAGATIQVSILAYGMGESPGCIPLGGIIATMPHLAGSYSCVATTAADIKGFVLCNGQTISDPSSPMNGASIPNINNDVFLMGTAGATSGAQVGSNSRDLTHTHSVTSNVSVGNHIDHTHSVTSNVSVGNHIDHTHSVTSNVAVASQTFTGTPATYTVSVPAHKHTTMTLASTIGLSGSAPSLTGTTTFAANGHTHTPGTMGACVDWESGNKIYIRQHALAWTSQYSLSTTYTPTTTAVAQTAVTSIVGTSDGNSSSASVDITGGSYSLTGSNSVTGTVGNTGATSGDSPFSASGSNTPAGTISVSLTNNAVTSGGASVTLSHLVTNNAVTSGGASVTLSHLVTNNAVTSGSGLGSTDIRPKYIAVKYVMRIK